jgi:DNA-binding beta-propeller fold protein YncE
VIDAHTDQVVRTVPLPRAAGEPLPEPMYVVYTPAHHRVWVGDRANDRVVVLNGRTFEVEATLPTGDGVWHMSADQAGHELWVVNDIDLTVTVIDAKKLQVVATVPMPADLTAAGARPHDVVLDPHGRSAYISFFGVPGAFDAVVQFETDEFTEVARARVGKDPHLAYNRRFDALYVPCQTSNVVLVLDADGLDLVDDIPVPGAHGAVTSTDARRFYTTNLPGLGADAVVCIDTRTNEVTGVADAPTTVPHNLELTPDGNKLYVTHSGPNNKVSVYDTSADGDPVYLGSISVGTNPFGLAYVP